MAGRHHGRSYSAAVLSLTNLYIGLKAGWGFGVGGALLTVCAAVLLEILSGTVLRIPDPPAILILTAVYLAADCVSLHAGPLIAYPFIISVSR